MSPQAKADAESEHPAKASKSKDVQAEALEKGYYGELPGGIPVEEYTLTTGPDSPSAAEALLAAAEANVELQRAAATEGEG